MAWSTTRTLYAVPAADLTVLIGTGGAPDVSIASTRGLAIRVDGSAGAVVYETADSGGNWAPVGASLALDDAHDWYGTVHPSGATAELAAALGRADSTTRSYASGYAVTDDEALVDSIDALDVRAERDAGTYAAADPGDGNAIPVTHSASVELGIGAGAETGTLANPGWKGQQLDIYAGAVAGGSRAITAASAVNQAGNTVMTFAAIGDFVRLAAIKVGAALRWQVVSNDGVALT